MAVERPPVGAIARVRAQPGSSGHGFRDVEILEHDDFDELRMKVRYVDIDRESDIALQRLERDPETREILIVRAP